MSETSYRFSPDRIKLLWLLLKKKGIDLAPQQISLSGEATGQVTNESDPEPMNQNHHGDGFANIQDEV
ncbi:MAG: hypothetical protein ABI977_27790 [Acidobacteriota bacterium]